MKVLAKLFKRFFNFLQSNLRGTLEEFQIEQRAKDPYIEIPVRLVMHGIPVSWVEKATMDQLLIFWKIMQNDQHSDEITYANGIGLAFGGNK